MNRGGILEMEKELSRRSFFGLIGKGIGAAAALDRLSPRLKAGIKKTRRPNSAKALRVYSAIGNLVIPVDQDPGWLTFEPGISQYGMNIYVRQIFLGNNDIAFDGFQDTLNDMDDVPAILGYDSRFLNMTPAAQNKYLTDILTGNYENDGYQDILSLAVNAAVVSAKTTFFSNFPRHLANPAAEFQVLAPSPVKTGWDLMGLKGPVGPAEERALRARYFDAEELPGIDTRNKWI